MNIKNQNQVVILGAGMPIDGEQHVSLRNISDNSRIADWLIHSIKELEPCITFVGGYQFEKINRQFPEVTYVENKNWQASGPVASFLTTPLVSNSDYYITYADIVFQANVVTELNNSDGDIVITVDTKWENRYAGRTEEDLDKCEKVRLYGDSVISLGSHILKSTVDGEFVGLVKFSPKVIEFIKSNHEELSDVFISSNMSNFVEYLRGSGFTINFIDVAGNWAELNDPKDIAHFILGTKAETLSRLYSMVTQSVIEKQISFTVKSWQDDNSPIILDIMNKLNSPSLVVRSSAIAEDGFNDSNAGAFTSLLNVVGDNSQEIIKAVEEVIGSYPDEDPRNQVLVQPMLKNVLASGVAFTRAISNGSPYYTINYDDTTESTESITSGVSCDDKTYIIYKKKSCNLDQYPEIIKNLIPAIEEIELLLNYDSLDIEFAVSKEQKIHILQVRPIAVEHNINESEEAKIEEYIKLAKSFFVEKQSNLPQILGSKNVFGIMPDWNPAEIIGTKPNVLAQDLYRYLIMDDIWAQQRAEYGYRDVRPSPLLVTFSGHPYVDVRASFNSFIPECIEDVLAEKLVDFYLARLIENPHFHDKVEFDVVPTCFAFDFDKWESILLEANFNSVEIKTIKNALKTITQKSLTRGNVDFDSVRVLKKRFANLDRKSSSPLDNAFALINDCKQYGTLAFSHLARSAFVAVTILRTSVAKGYISQKAMDSFLSSIRTVSHEFVEDGMKAGESQSNWDDYVVKYGHLRPGTYDISSQCYADDPEKYLKSSLVSSSSEGSDDINIAEWEKCKVNIVTNLLENDIDTDIETLEHFLRSSIEGREYAKFIFTQNLSTALNEISKFGENIGISKNELSNIPLSVFDSIRTGTMSYFNLAKELKDISEKNSKINAIQSLIEFPPLLTNKNDFDGFLYPHSQPNFIGTEKIIDQVVDLSKDGDVSVENKIVMIPQADPGFDWLFSMKIKGLITMYGGANSHMAIRAAEFGIPAAIGIGETEYEKLSLGKNIEIDPINRKLRVV